MLKLKIAVISDIHGNLHALQAVIQDAKENAVDFYIFLGDYCNGFAYPNEVIETIKSMENTYIIHGNGEGYLKNLSCQDKSTWTSEQFAPVYWTYRTVSVANREWLFALPDKKEIFINGKLIFMAHSPTDIFGKTVVDNLSGRNYPMHMEKSSFMHIDYLQYADAILKSDEQLATALEELQNGIYLFGHFHTQWHIKLNNQILVNPGSCGNPLDFDNRSPYTILNYVDNQWIIEEKRVSYDIQKAISALKNSPLYNETKIWCEVNIESLLTAKEQALTFLGFVEKIANELGDINRPYSNFIWNLASARWLNDDK